MTKVLVTDHTFDPLDIEQAILAPLGCTIDAWQCKSPEQLLPVVADADAVITQFADVSARVIAAMSRAKVIVRYGIGVDNVDLDAARQRGIPVCNVPDFCIDEVADHTLAFILATTRRVVDNCLNVRGGNWALAVPLDRMRALCDMTVGIVGFGRIGRAVRERLRAFGCRVRVFDPLMPPAEIEKHGAVPAATFDELLPTCDLITLHCPSTPQTRRLVDRAALARLKPGAILINVSRGNVVDTAALLEALQSGRLAAAALDVCDPEPIGADHPLVKMPNVIVSAHVASASPKAARRLREAAANLVACAVRGEPLPNVVNGVKGR